MPRRKAKRAPEARSDSDEDIFEIVLDPPAVKNKKRKRGEGLEVFTEQSDWHPKLNVRYSVRVKGKQEGDWKAVREYKKFQGWLYKPCSSG